MIYEETFGSFDYYAASDECGRGPLAGPVVACSVGVRGEFLRPYLANLSSLGVCDSKKLTPSKIKKIIKWLELPLGTLSIRKNKTLYSSKFEKLDIVVSVMTHTYIDQNNILVASLEAMKNSFSRLNNKKTADFSNLWLIDGPYSPMKRTINNLKVVPVIRGDSHSILIGLSSIIAKYYRDEMMNDYQKKYPEYGFSKHKGYPTKMHLQAIKNFGPSEIHRRSFRGVLDA